MVDVPVVAPVAPVLVPRERLSRMTEELHLHLLKLARTEGEVARSDLVAEALPNLSDAERNLHSARIADVLEVDEHPLRGLGTQEGHVLFAAHGTGVGLEHQIEVARFGELALVVLAGCLRGLDRTLARRDMVGTEAAFALAAVDQFVGEQVVVARHLPHLRVHHDRRFEADHVVARRRTGERRNLVVRGNHVGPPRLPHVAFQLDTERPVVPEAVQPAVDFRRLKDKPAPLGESHDLVHTIFDSHVGKPFGAEEDRSQESEQGAVIVMDLVVLSYSGTKSNRSYVAARVTCSAKPSRRQLRPPRLI